MRRLTWLSVKQLLYQMAKRPELLCGAIALSCTLIVALKFTYSRATDVVLPPRPPVRFFSARSPVIDLYLGQLDQANEIRLDSEVSVLYFYAPWCGQSILTRTEIDNVARRLADQVLFVAVNCWWNQGKCRKQKNFVYYPVIYLYHRRFGPIEYKGPLTAAYIETFVRRVMMPLLYISSHDGLWNFLLHYEPGVIGYFEFNASPQPPGYLTFFTSALHALRRDYLGTVRFGVITDKRIASEISLTHSGSMYLHRHFNTSLVFPSDTMNFTAQTLHKWAIENREIFLHWLRPHGGKSLLLHNELKKGPALLMFLPFNPLAENLPLLDEITEVALQYNCCNKSLVALRQQQVDVSTLTPTQVEKPFFMAKYPCCNTVVLPQWHTISRTHNVCELCVNQTVGVRPSRVNIPQCNFLEMVAALDAFYLKEHIFMQVIASTIECSNFPTFYSPFSYYTACCKTLSKGLISIHSGQTILPDPNAAFSSHGKDHGRDSYSRFPHIEGGSSPEIFFRNTSVMGLKCRMNKTLNLHLLDSNLHWEFAVRLGASRSAHMKEFAAIVDLKEEVHYVMDQNQVFTKPTLEAFIQNYSSQYSPLKRHLLSDHPAQLHPSPLIIEVTSSTFHSIVLDNEKDILLLYYSQRCGSCGVLSHVFIQLARLLQPAKDFAVARINADRNDLPWEFMVYRLPTILFFPRKRKDQSVKYPEEQQVTLPNLMRFILRHSRAPSTSANSCSPECIQEETELQQGRIHQLEMEIKRLRAEIQALHQAQDQMNAQLSHVRQDKWELNIENHVLRGQNSALNLQRERLQHLYEQKNKELEETAGKLTELADVSENLLSENTLLRLVVASIGGKIKANQVNENKFSGTVVQEPSEKNGPDQTDKAEVHEDAQLETGNLEPVHTPENTLENRTD